ncbi:hypothetical protein LRU_01513 [Ligilactobacillus ruminis SPM0211]|uniref:Uncharacterized protein n=1 Tax=Ligilactobacillus ruminis SPM0211 TaxID=1040964 RepID=F7R1E4_9LACO|nr:hypothetical protein LRU_01513 [Ligilactobacillus ruminis SPM0211]
MFQELVNVPKTTVANYKLNSSSKFKHNSQILHFEL